MFAARLIEDASKTGVQGELDRDALTWATVDSNGLQVFLAGTAPTEAARFRALSAAGRAVDAARVIDQMDVEDPNGLAPPQFTVEILRNDAGLSLIGLIPADTDREALLTQIGRRVGENVPISDFLETAGFPPPKDWEDSLDFGLSLLGDLPRSKISIETGQVVIKAMARSGEERRRLESEFVRRAPDGVRVALDLSAPRPVISPFTLRYVIEGGRARFDACSADSQDAIREIGAAAARGGLEGRIECRIGLGVPSRRWSEAAALSMDALSELGGGDLTIADTDISIIAPEGTDQNAFDRIIGELESTLPAVFALSAVLPEIPDATDQGPPDFRATLEKNGDVRLSGRINSDIARQTAESFARAQFGSDAVTVALRTDTGLQATWSVRVLAALATLDTLGHGEVTVTPSSVAVTGDTGSQTASADIAGLLTERLGDGQEFDIQVRYRERLDPTLNIPTPENCVRGITDIIGSRKITFEPGSATIDETTTEIMDEVADLLRRCGRIALEIQGHTDSQGREVMNQELSQQRADAILTALRDRRVLTASYVARGYGETTPIADNGTEAGREANRRIEFTLLSPDPVDEDTPLDSASEPGDTDAAPEGQE